MRHKTIRRAAIELGISTQAVYKHLAALGITPLRDEMTGWQVLSPAQFRLLAARDRKPGPKNGQARSRG